VRQKISPLKIKSDEWLEVMQVAHELGLKSSATMMFGHVETIAERIEHLQRVRDQQEASGGFTAFICWTFQPGEHGLESEAEDDAWRNICGRRRWPGFFWTISKTFKARG
jgi:cyclic dehypoxanthinyl futalosine synthase